MRRSSRREILRERIFTATERKRDALTEKETGIIEFHEIPPEVAVFRAPDGRLPDYEPDEFRIRYSGAYPMHQV